MKTENCSIPIGSDFLPNTSRQYLVQCQRKEKKTKVKMRLLAYIMRRDGKTIRGIERELNTPYSTVHGWLRRAAEEGIRGRHDKKIPGSRSKLDDQQTRQLAKDLAAGPEACGLDEGVWTAPILIRHIKKKFGVTYVPTGIYALLRRIGFSWQAPRPMHPKSASKEEQKEFKKKAKRTVRYYVKRGYTVFTEDEAAMVQGATRMRTWAPRGGGTTAPSFLSKKRFHMFGALSEDRFVCRLYDRADTQSMVRFLKELHRRYGKIVVFTDNASIHKAHDVKDLVKECKGEIVIKYYLPYTPQLNKVENQWLNVRRFTANKMFESLDECKKFVRKGLNSGKIKIVEMSDYLM